MNPNNFNQNINQYRNEYDQYDQSNEYDYAQNDYYYDQNQEYYSADYEEYHEEATNLEADDYDQMEELEREIMNSNPTIQQGIGNRSFVPSGAMPSQGGVLSPHAAEFWFPECRNCPCCNGYKHGCKCVKKGVDTCTDPSCVDQEHTAQVTKDLNTRSNETVFRLVKLTSK